MVVHSTDLCHQTSVDTCEKGGARPVGSVCTVCGPRQIPGRRFFVAVVRALAERAARLAPALGALLLAVQRAEDAAPVEQMVTDGNRQ